ncbi:MAG: signal recognition particle-docking protein FtsY [Clostridiales bacterium GWF2_38_85]|nr:MAG: signal recognition particle-docking protein FtsY [Clostridiales bacterium GWF2_38_85]HBL83887.1 signal recognition particle-docking protein FtsY [Clostridiales bacterium]
MGFFDKLKAGLSKTKKTLLAPLEGLFSSYDKINDDFYEELLDILICADVGATVSDEIVGSLKSVIKEKNLKSAAEAKLELMAIISEMIGEGCEFSIKSPMTVMLIIGVNGVGKTTSIGKIAKYLTDSGSKVMLAAADTFRAAAIDQLQVWADRVDVPLIKQSEGSDPAAVVFDAIGAAKKQKCDVLIIDTAGRLHNKKNLLDELSKINRIIDREVPDSYRETMLVLDAVTGQNGITQAKEFAKAAKINGLILTKLDGTAKGGIIIAIKKELGIPVKFIGVGEGIEDMQPFSGKEFVEALFDIKNTGNE